MDSNTTIYFQNKVTYMFQLIFSHHQNYKTISNINICMGLRFQKQNINMQSWEKFGGYKTVPLCKILNITEKKILNMWQKWYLKIKSRVEVLVLFWREGLWVLRS